MNAYILKKHKNINSKNPSRILKKSKYHLNNNFNSSVTLSTTASNNLGSVTTDIFC